MAEEERDYGYPTNMFIQTPPDAFMCTICQGVLRQAQRVCDNDHIYCDSCVGQWTRSSNKCPTCRSVMSVKPARVVNNLIAELATHCCSVYGQDERAQAAAEETDLPAAKRRKTSAASASSASAEASASSTSSASSPPPAFCDWTGPLADAEAHKKVCLFELEECPFKSCTHKVIRRDLEAHKARCWDRAQVCADCAEEVRASTMRYHLLWYCPATISTCSNRGCEVSLTRKDLDVHRSTVCPYQDIPCPYKEQFGCEHRALRKDMAQHSDNASIHLPLIAIKLARLPILEARSVHLERAAVEESRTTTMLRSHLKASLGQARNVRVDDVRVDNGEEDEKWRTEKGAYSGQMREESRHGYGHFLCDDGDTYEGEWADDFKEGQGTYTLHQSAEYVYKGAWKEDQRHGKGVVFMDGKLYYDGDWQDGELHGQGTLRSGKSVYTGDFRHHKKDGKGIWNETEDGLGDSYDGEWKDNEYEGQGTFTYSEDKEVYTGQWAKGKREGQGIMTDKDGGVIYDGPWANNKKHGQGKYKYKHYDEYTYEGEFQAGMRCGKGRVLEADGNTYDGDWANDFKSGEGTHFYAGRDPPHIVGTYVGSWWSDFRSGMGVMTEDGSVYSGNWVDDAKHGEGTLTSADGTVLRGTWESDQMHGAFVRLVDGVEKQEQWEDGEQIEGGVAAE
ncbi:hypothetical protein B484DRAFT_456399 [Ochromonadaceae sp. CCMP2298]|nr:hypothetical protein B484DRAFT_456399 [Ochromonadaceae sp. CCMP2298]